MLVMSLAACLAAQADPSPRWEYAVIVQLAPCPVFIGPTDPPLPAMPDGALDYGEAQKRCLTGGETTASKLSTLGAQGWELVGFQGDYTYFKRRK